MNILIISKNLKKNPSAQDIRLHKIIEFFSKKNKVFVLSYSGSIKSVRNVTHLTWKKPSKRRIISSLLYGTKLRRNLDQLVHKYDIDIIYSQEAIAIYHSRNLATKKIYDVVGLMHSEASIKDKGFEAMMKQAYYKQVETRALKSADYILTVNDAHKKKISTITDSKNVFVLRDGVNKIFYNKYVRKENSTITVSFVGTFFRDRFQGLIDYLPKIVAENPKIHFEIIGDGRFVDIYKKKTQNFKLSKNIQYLGYIDNHAVHEYLKKSDICFSDDWSYIGFPTKVFEYMAMGKAVLVEDTPAVREIIKPLKNGAVYKDPKDFYIKVLLLANHPELRRQLGQKARDDAKKYTWDIREKEFNSILLRINKNGK